MISSSSINPVRPRVLFVDDEPMVLQALKGSLRKYFDVSTAGSGEAALDLLASEPSFSVVVSDYRMPAMNGAAFLACVRERYPTIIRLLLTGAGAEGEDVTNDPGLVFRMLSKPCSRDTLIRTIEESLGGWAERA
jgi:DNA-binding NtrC family response regulator